MATSTLTSIAFLLATGVAIASAIQMRVGIDHDLSKPTYGLQGPTSSQMTYDEQRGLNVSGTLGDILGPPLKIANGFGNMLAGSKMVGVGSGLSSGGAVLGLDAKLLEAAGGAHLLRGGLLMGGAMAKKGMATALGGLPAKKIASIIELPVKVIALKDLAAGKTLLGIGGLKAVEAAAKQQKGANMMQEGHALKTQGLNQVVTGASEGVANLGNMVQQTAEKATTAFRLLPLILDSPAPQQQQHEELGKTSQQQQQSNGYQMGAAGSGPGLTGGSLFGGLTSLLPGLNDPFALSSNQQPVRSPFNLFGGGLNNGHSGYAAVLNSTNPLTNLLMMPNMNPLLFPLASGPLGQAIGGKQPFAGGSNTQTFNLFPGLKWSESSSSGLPNSKHGQQMDSTKTQNVELQPQPQQEAVKQIQQDPQVEAPKL